MFTSGWIAIASLCAAESALVIYQDGSTVDVLASAQFDASLRCNLLAEIEVQADLLDPVTGDYDISDLHVYWRFLDAAQVPVPSVVDQAGEWIGVQFTARAPTVVALDRTTGETLVRANVPIGQQVPGTELRYDRPDQVTAFVEIGIGYAHVVSTADTSADRTYVLTTDDAAVVRFDDDPYDAGPRTIVIPAGYDGFEIGIRGIGDGSYSLRLESSAGQFLCESERAEVSSGLASDVNQLILDDGSIVATGVLASSGDPTELDGLLYGSSGEGEPPNTLKLYSICVPGYIVCTNDSTTVCGECMSGNPSANCGAPGTQKVLYVPTQCEASFTFTTCYIGGGHNEDACVWTMTHTTVAQCSSVSGALSFFGIGGGVSGGKSKLCCHFSKVPNVTTQFWIKDCLSGGPGQ